VGGSWAWRRVGVGVRSATSSEARTAGPCRHDVPTSRGACLATCRRREVPASRAGGPCRRRVPHLTAVRAGVCVACSRSVPTWRRTGVATRIPEVRASNTCSRSVPAVRACTSCRRRGPHPGGPYRRHPGGPYRRRGPHPGGPCRRRGPHHTEAARGHVTCPWSVPAGRAGEAGPHTFRLQPGYPLRNRATPGVRHGPALAPSASILATRTATAPRDRSLAGPRAWAAPRTPLCGRSPSVSGIGRLR
jgi:hypothetical protein